MRTDKMKTLVWVAVLTAFATIAQADEPQKMLDDGVLSSEQVIVINDFEGEILDGVARGVEWWDHDSGGTSGRLEFTDENPATGKKCAVFHYDSTYGDRRSFIQTHMRYGLPPGGKELSLQVRSPQGGTLFLRILGSDGQTHQYRLRTKNDNQWERFSIDLTKKSPECWGKNRDNIIRQPVGNLIFLITARAPQTGTFYLDQIEVTTTASTAELTDWFWSRKNAKVCLQTGLPGNLYYHGEPAEARVVAMPGPPAEMNLNVNVDKPAEGSERFFHHLS